MRVGVTEEEADLLGRWPAEDDAGETGPMRPRSVVRSGR